MRGLRFAVAACLALAGCAESPSPKVAIIGLDAANWASLVPLMEEGRLPNLERMMRQGAHGELGTLLPTVSPALWTTVATGKGMAAHGVSVRVVSLDEGRSREINSSLSSHARRVKALWEIYTDRGLRSCFLGWWATWPAEEVAGVIVSDRFLQSGLSGGVYPRSLEQELEKHGLLALQPPPTWHEYLEELEGRITAFESSPAGAAYDTREIRDLREHVSALRNMSSLDWRVLRIAEHVLRDPKGWDLVGIYFWYLDVVQHLFWKYWRPEGFAVPDAERDLFHDVIPRYYELMDHVVGRLLGDLSRETNVLVLSDHGMESYYSHRYLNDLFEVGPLLESLDLIKRNEAGVVDTLSSEVISLTACRNLRLLTLAPREAESPEQRAVRGRRVTSTLAGLRAEPSGTPLFQDVVVMQDGQTAYKGSGFLAYTFEHADILALLAAHVPRGDSLPTPAGWIRLAELCPWAPEKTGYHSAGPPGMIIAAGPSIRSGATVTEASLLDISPTVLALGGLPVADDMEGRVLEGMIAAAHWNRFPLTAIGTYEDGTRLPRLPAPGVDDDGAVLDRLRALGYIP